MVLVKWTMARTLSTLKLALVASVVSIVLIYLLRSKAFKEIYKYLLTAIRQYGTIKE